MQVRAGRQRGLYRGGMTTPWGNDDRGLDGEQSWLGGPGRSGHEVTPGGTEGGAAGGAQGGSGSSDGWSSDFGPDTGSRPDGAGAGGGQAQSSDPADSSARQYQGPQFGNGGDRSDGNDSGWATDFHGTNGSQGNGSAVAKKTSILGAIVTIIALVVIAVIAYRSGTQIWWMVFFVGVPLVRRLVRLLGRGARR